MDDRIDGAVECLPLRVEGNHFAAGGPKSCFESGAKSTAIADDCNTPWRIRIRLSLGCQQCFPRALNSGSDFSGFITAFRQHFQPARAIEQRIVGAQVQIGETPPAFREPERNVDPPLEPRDFQKEQCAGRSEQGP